MSMRTEGGYVYALQNASFPGILKIGMTVRNPFDRASELHTTGVPTPFFVAFCVFVPDALYLEKVLHAHFADQRINTNREFFEVELSELVAAILPYLSGRDGGDQNGIVPHPPTQPTLSIPATVLLMPEIDQDATLLALNGEDYFSRLSEAVMRDDVKALDDLTELASRSPEAVKQLRKLVLFHDLAVQSAAEQLLTTDDDFFLGLLAARTDIAVALGQQLLQLIRGDSLSVRWLRRSSLKKEDIVLRFVDFVDFHLFSLRNVTEAFTTGCSIASDLATFVSEKQRAVWTWRTPENRNLGYERKLLLARELFRVLKIEPYREWPTDVVAWPIEAFPAPLWPLPEGDIDSKLSFIQERAEEYLSHKTDY